MGDIDIQRLPALLGYGVFGAIILIALFAMVH